MEQLADKTDQNEGALCNVACSLCGAHGTETIFEATLNTDLPLEANDFNCTNPGHGEHYRIVKCTNCNMVYCSPRPSALAIATAYGTSEDVTYVEGEEGRRRTFRRALKDFERKQGTLLDVGCHTGVFMEEAKKIGFNVFGIEPSAYSARRAVQEKGLQVHCGIVPGSIPWEQEFDVVTMWDVIEHLDDPLGVLKFLATKLNPDGTLHLSTMNLDSPYAYLSGRNWPWLMRMHIQYFTKETITKMLKEAGFHRVKIQAYRHIVHVDYLLSKLENVHPFLRFIGKLGATFLKDSDDYIAVNMGDMMHVTAWLK